MARLSTMTSVYKQLHTLNPKLLYWQYTSLESGLHSCYPGHGGYPNDYDPRVRPWYVETKKTDGLTWIPPTPEVSTGTHTMAVCMPLRSPDGAFIGATAIDIPLDGILDTLTLPKEWAVGATKVFVYPEPEFVAQGKLAIIASRTYQEYATDWREKLDLDFLAADRPEDMRLLVADAFTGKSAVRTMSYRGQKCLWAYVGGGEETPFPVVIVPYNRIVAEAAAAEGYVHQRTLEGITSIGYLFMAIVVVAVIVAFWRSRHFTRPIRRLAEAAQSLAAGNYETRVDVRTGDELQHLGDVVNELGPQLEERQRMKQALALAVEIQQHLLPTSAPSIDGFDISGRSVYCDETGGDYYDFIELVEVGDGKLGVAIGDVTGHGIGAALLMASARAVLRSQAGSHGLDLSALFARLNDHLVRDTGDERFMTLFYGVLDAGARTLTWTSGGHDPALWLRRASGEIEELPNTGIPLGVMERAEFGQEGPVTLQSGDIVLIGTDGIWETASAQGEEFGKSRLRAILTENAGLDSEGIRAAVVRAVADFRAGGPQEDDITLVVIKAG
jgi:sigma-B regulation protein RsbU (phosphoserine phosphatase)